MTYSWHGILMFFLSDSFTLAKTTFSSIFPGWALTPQRAQLGNLGKKETKWSWIAWGFMGGAWEVRMWTKIPRNFFRKKKYKKRGEKKGKPKIKKTQKNKMDGQFSKTPRRSSQLLNQTKVAFYQVRYQLGWSGCPDAFALGDYIYSRQIYVLQTLPSFPFVETLGEMETCSGVTINSRDRPKTKTAFNPRKHNLWQA